MSGLCFITIITIRQLFVTAVLTSVTTVDIFV